MNFKEIILYNKNIKTTPLICCKYDFVRYQFK